MVRGLYTAASGAIVAEAAVDTIANNLANVDTAGFKRTLLQVQAQPQRDIYRAQTNPGQLPNASTPGVPSVQRIGSLGSGAEVYDTPANFEQGAIASTGNDLDVALSGPGFFAIRDANGALSYTRDGQFVRDAQGYLSAQNGDRVLSDNGSPIVLPTPGAVSIGRTGTVSVTAARSRSSGSPSSRTRTRCARRAPIASSIPATPPARGPRRTRARCKARSRRATPTSSARWSTSSPTSAGSTRTSK